MMQTRWMDFLISDQWQSMQDFVKTYNEKERQKGKKIKSRKEVKVVRYGHN